MQVVEVIIVGFREIIEDCVIIDGYFYSFEGI